MHVNVQRAARRLGVSPVTIRRWTATGFLPCIRTPGGHRRIDTDDLDELARAIAADSALAAKVARERDLETVADASVSLGSKHDLREVLSEIARQVTRVLQCDACVIYEHVPEQQLVRVVADFDGSGRLCPTNGPYRFADFPLTGRVIEERITVWIDRDDPAADPAEVADLVETGYAQMMYMPLVYGGRSLGMLEAAWLEKVRRRTRQELRIAQAVADEAAVAIVNARAIAAGRASDRMLALQTAFIRDLRQALPAIVEAPTPENALSALAETVCTSLDARSCAITKGDLRAEHVTLGTAGPESTDGTPGAHVVVGESSSFPAKVRITVTLCRAPTRAVGDLLGLAADLGSALLTMRDR